MKYLFIILSLFLLLIFQTGILIPVGLPAAGNLVLVFVMISVMFSDFTQGLVVALIGGLLLDFISGTVDGTNIISILACVGFTYFFINKLVPKESNRFIIFVLAALNTLIFSVAFFLVNRLFSLINLDTAIGFGQAFGSRIMWDLVINLIFVYPILILHNFLLRKFNPVFR